MNERPPSGEGEPKEHRSSVLRWFLQHWRISYLLGVEQNEPRRGLLRYWPLIVTLLALVAVHVMLDDDIKVLPPLMLLALVLVLLVPIFYARQRGLHALARFLGWGLLTLSTAVVASSVVRLVVKARNK